MEGVEEISWPPRDPHAINQMEKVFAFLWPKTCFKNLPFMFIVYKGTDDDINVLTGNDTTGKTRATRRRVSFTS